MALLLMLVPIFAVIFMNLCFKCSIKKLAIVLGLLVCFIQALVVINYGAVWLDFSLSFLEFQVDGLSLILLLSIAIVAFASILVASSSMSDGKKLFNFINILLLCVTGMNGVVMVRDIFSLYIFLEVTAIASFIMIALNKDVDAFEGSFKYLVMSAVATVMMLSSIALIMMYAGDTSFYSVGTAVQGENNLFIIFAVCIFMVALFIKAGLVPFHGWLPDAYSSAPASVSVLLAGIVTKTTGVYTLIRLVSEVFTFNYTIRTILLIVGIITIFIGAFAAIGQKDIKRMLAYSSISQVGYIILALGTGTALGIAGAVFHLFNHSIFKTQLFVNATAVEQQTGTRDINNMSGLTNSMPITGWTSVIGFLSTAGIPPLSGFWSKLIIVVALWKAGLHGYAGLAIMASLVTLAYFLYMQRKVFFGKSTTTGIKEAGLGFILPALILAIITVVVGVFFPYFVDTIIIPTANLF